MNGLEGASFATMKGHQQDKEKAGGKRK